MTEKEIRQEFNSLIRPKIDINHMTCVYCNQQAEVIHHLIPISFGGDNRSSNLIPLCNNCHNKLHNYNQAKDWKQLQKAGIERAKKKANIKADIVKK